MNTSLVVLLAALALTSCARTHCSRGALSPRAADTPAERRGYNTLQEPRRAWSEPIPVGTNHLIRSLAFLLGNESLVVGCDKGVVKVFDDCCPDRKSTWNLQANSYETKLAVAAEGRRILVTGCPGGASLFDLSKGDEPRNFERLVFGSFGLSPDGTRMWADDSVYDLTGANEPKRVRQFEGSEVLQVSDKQIITAKAGKISFWNPANGKLQREFDTGNPKTRFHSLSPAGYLVVSDDRGVHVWDFARGQRMASVPVKETCHAALISPDGKRLVTNTGKYTVRVWDLATGKVIATLATTEYYWPMALAPDGSLAFTRDGHRIEFYATHNTR